MKQTERVRVQRPRLKVRPILHASLSADDKLLYTSTFFAGCPVLGKQRHKYMRGVTIVFRLKKDDACVGIVQPDGACMICPAFWYPLKELSPITPDDQKEIDRWQRKQRRLPVDPRAAMRAEGVPIYDPNDPQFAHFGKPKRVKVKHKRMGVRDHAKNKGAASM